MLAKRAFVIELSMKSMQLCQSISTDDQIRVSLE